MGGNTEYAALQIAGMAGADLLKIKPVKQYPDKGLRKFLWGGKSAVMAEEPPLLQYEFNAADYDQIIFGFPVWAANIAPPIRSFIKEQKGLLAGKKFAAFACQSGSGAEKAFRKLEQCLDIAPISKTLILFDPKDKPESANEEKMTAFAKTL